MSDLIRTIGASRELVIAAAPSGDKSLPRFSGVVYTGNAMPIGPRAAPMLAIDLSGLAITRQDIPVLFNHDPERIVGHTSSLTLTSRELLAAGILSGADDDVARVKELGANGYPWQMSVGLVEDKAEIVKLGATATINGRQFTGPLYVVRAGTLREISFVSTGADSATSATVAAKLGGKAMSERIATDDVEPVDFETAVLAERERARRIHRLAGSFPKIADEAITENWSPEKTENMVLRAKLANGVRPMRPGSFGGGSGLSNEHIEAGLLVRLGYESAAVREFGEQVVTEAKPFHRASLPDLFTAIHAISGLDVPRDRSRLIEASLSLPEVANILSNAAGKVAFETWRQSPGTWRSFCNVRSADDFKSKLGLRPTWGGELAPVPPGGPVIHGTIGEETYMWSVAQYAKLYRIDRTHIVNDDLDVLMDVVPGLAKAAMRMTSNLVWSKILAGIGTHFAAGNKNSQTGGGSVLAAAGLATAIRQMRLMKDPAGSPVDVVPRVLCVPPSLEPTALALLRSIELNRTGDNLPSGNPFAGLNLQLEIESRLEAGVTDPSNGAVHAGSATRWFLFAGPVDIPMVTAFLDGNEFPRVETFGLDADPDHLAVAFRVVLDVGAALADKRAGQYSDGV